LGAGASGVPIDLLTAEQFRILFILSHVIPNGTLFPLQFEGLWARDRKNPSVDSG
jgi:hypothetical protein